MGGPPHHFISVAHRESRPRERRAILVRTVVAPKETHLRKRHLATGARFRCRDRISIRHRDARAGQARGEFYKWLAATALPEDAAVDGLRTLIEIVVRLLFPVVRSGDDLVRAILDGEPTTTGGTLLPGTAGFRSALLTLSSAPSPPSPGNASMGSWVADMSVAPRDRLLARMQSWQNEIRSNRFGALQPDLDDAILRLELATASVEWTAAISNATTPAAKTHTVVKGDTLANIARRYYGDWTKWRMIAESNKISDPANLSIGTQLLIP